MVDVHQARAVDRFELTEFLPGVLAIVRPLEVGPRAVGERHTGAVGHHVPDGGAVLAVAGVLRQVVADPVVEGEASAFHQHVHHGRGDRLGGGVHAERRLRRHRHQFGARWIRGSVSPRVADGAIEDDAAVVAQAQLDRRLHARPVPVLDGTPDALHRGRGQRGVILLADGGHCRKVRRHRDPPVRVGGHDIRCRVAPRCC